MILGSEKQLFVWLGIGLSRIPAFRDIFRTALPYNCRVCVVPGVCLVGAVHVPFPSDVPLYQVC